MLHQLPRPLWCHRKISLTLVPFITSTQASCKLPGPFPLTYSFWNPFLCFCALSGTKHTLSTKPMKHLPHSHLYKKILTALTQSFTKNKQNKTKPPPNNATKAAISGSTKFYKWNTRTLTVLRNMLALHLDLQALLTGLRWTRRSPI